mgnify:CR=1 FL=1
MKCISDITQDIFENEFMGEFSMTNPDCISGWLDSNVGKLNTQLYECFSGQSGTYCFNDQAGDIYKLMYMQDYYTKQAAIALRGILDGTGGSNILSVKEGDTAVTRVNKNEVAKTMRSVATDYSNQIDSLVGKYQIYISNPVQVAGEDGCY